MLVNGAANMDQYYANLKATMISYLPTSNHVPFLRKAVHYVLEKLCHVEAALRHGDEYQPQGELHEASDETWAAFMEVYGEECNPEEEERFDQQLRSRPLNWIHDCPIVKILYERDAA